MNIIFAINPYILNMCPDAVICLTPNNWDDFGYKTLFSLSIRYKNGASCDIGSIKIAFKDQVSGWTKDKIEELYPEKIFKTLTDDFFSLGQDVEYYQNLMKISPSIRNTILKELNDIAYNLELFNSLSGVSALNTSLLRYTSLMNAKTQYHRVLNGMAALSEYKFRFYQDRNEKYSDYSISINVKPDSKPNSNIHVLIGRNGVGKTTILNNIVQSLFQTNYCSSSDCKFEINHPFPAPIGLTDYYFSGVISVSFSAFDVFIPPLDNNSDKSELRYYYVGIKQIDTKNRLMLKNKDDMAEELFQSLRSCFSVEEKKQRWLSAINYLESDPNFQEMQLTTLSEELPDHNKGQILSTFNKMSSGHAVVFLTVTRLVETLEEKTLVLIDEPETHLHPPLLSAFTRTLSELLTNRNAIAIIATHSPVVLQEVPASCVNIMKRYGGEITIEKPEIETFAENVGLLTHKIFGLEVIKSGFYSLLNNDAQSEKTLTEVMSDYNNQIGLEGKLILQSLLSNKN